MNPLLIQLLLSIGGSLGESLVKNPQLQTVIGLAVNETQNLISILTGNAGKNVAAPVFFSVLQAAFGVLQAEGKLTADEVSALNAAITATIQADQAAQQVVDPTVLKPLAPLA